MKDGILIVNKHKGVTSHDIIYKVRRLFCTKQVGHTGTLDPLAEGVLCVLVGRAVKASEYLVEHDKRYQAVLKLGLTTDTEDISGNVLSTCDKPLPESDDVIKAALEFKGDIMQIPPMYSALKRDGVKLADLARKGIEIEREARPVAVYDIGVTAVNPESGEYKLDVHCSKGTYIRTLCADIGKRLGCGGVMSSLVRTESGGFKLADSYSVEQLENMTEEQRLACLIPTERLFDSCPVLSLSDFPAHLSHNGAELYLDRNRSDIKKSRLSPDQLREGSRLRLYDANGFYAIGDVTAYPDGLAVKTVKLFRL